MVTFAHARGAIFDVDDTLLNNYAHPSGRGIHEISRLTAIHEVARLRNLPQLAMVTATQNHDAFRTASVHSLAGAVWNILRRTGLVADTDTIDNDNPLLQDIVARKNDTHEALLRAHGQPLPGAPEFVRRLKSGGLTRLAIASAAIPRDLSLGLEVIGLDGFFPPERIISLADVTRPKPDPESFNKAFASLDLPESARSVVWAFEDDPRGITAAHAANLYVIAITSRYSRSELQGLSNPPNLVADSFAEFTRLLHV